MSNAIAESVLESLFSKPRIARYAVNPRGAAASVAYLYNLQLAESIMPCLHILEVALRNAIDRQLKAKYGRTDWWAIAPTLTPKEIEVISSAQRNIQMKRHMVTPDRIVSELGFGSLFSTFATRQSCGRNCDWPFLAAPRTNERGLKSVGLSTWRETSVTASVTMMLCSACIRICSIAIRFALR